MVGTKAGIGAKGRLRLVGSIASWDGTGIVSITGRSFGTWIQIEWIARSIAEVHARRAAELAPGNASVLGTLGWALFKLGRVDEALDPLGKAAAALTGNSVIQDHHGDALAKKGKAAEAVAAWERALAGDGESIDRAAVEKKIKAAKSKLK